MNAQTPRIAAAMAYAKTGDLEAAFLAGYAAEGRIGKGIMPVFIDGPTTGKRGGDRNTGILKRILEAVRNGNDTSSSVADACDICPSYASAYLNKLERKGRVRKDGWRMVNGGKAHIWRAAE